MVSHTRPQITDRCHQNIVYNCQHRFVHPIALDKAVHSKPVVTVLRNVSISKLVFRLRMLEMRSVGGENVARFD